jgi:methylase of polypeptide subunit release factors
MTRHITNDIDDIDGVRAALDEASYVSETIVRHLGGAQDAKMDRASIPRVLRATAGGTPLDTLIRLFAVGVSVPITEARLALAPMPLERWIDGKLVTRSGEQVSSDICILPQYGIRILHDPPHSQGRKTKRRTDFVMGNAASSDELIKLAVPAKGRALDLGTGCGAVAILMAPTASEVVATDINPRAIEFARFNTGLNQVENVDVRLGSLFEPIKDEKFDHIVSNPPFVISPNDGYMYRRGPFEGDKLVEYIATHAVNYLNPGGSLRMMAQWAQVSGIDWQARWRTCLEHLPVDTFILEHYTQSRLRYPQEWLKADATGDEADYATQWEAWRAHLEYLNIEAITTGVVALSVREQTPCRFEAITDQLTTDKFAGAYLSRLFQQWALLDQMDDDAVLRSRPHVPGDIHLESVSISNDGQWKTSDLVLRSNAGLVGPIRLDGPIATLIGWCDGKRSIRDLSKRLAREMTANAESLERALAPVIRRFMERGFLILDSLDPRPLEQLY